MSVEKVDRSYIDTLANELNIVAEVVESVEEGIVVEKYYKCGYCDIPDRFDDIEFVKKHHEVCIQSVKNKSCTTCKHLEIIKTAPYPRLAKNYEDMQLKVWLGSYVKGYCGKKKKELCEKNYFKKYKCWEKYDGDVAIVEHFTKEYKEFLDLTSKE